MPAPPAGAARSPGPPQLRADLQEPVERPAPPGRGQVGHPGRRLLPGRLPCRPDQGLPGHAQPGTYQAQLVQPLTNQAEQHDRAVLDQCLGRQPVRASCKSAFVAEQNPRWAFTWFTWSVRVWARDP